MGLGSLCAVWAGMWIWAVKVRETDCVECGHLKFGGRLCGEEERSWFWDEKTVLEEREPSLPEL